MNELREELACLEHEQWMKWAKDIVVKESISSERKTRWQEYFVHYSELAEEVKEEDRFWADKVLALFEEALVKARRDGYEAAIENYG